MGRSRILVGERLGSLKDYLPVQRSVIITDTEVNRLYGEKFPRCPVITIGRGEGVKTLSTLETIFDKLIELGADRSWFIAGVGGGIVCDITGFAASTYMRGVDFGFVATTLLAQVDASVGGKNGVNFKGYKNMVGVFNQPAFVICDPEVLKTLPPKEIRCGFAEIIKHGAIADAALFRFMEENIENAHALDRGVIERFVSDSVTIKSGVVNRDETEKGERRKLNFGHTLGHAFEKCTGITHGEAVAAGMCAAADLSVRIGFLAESQSLRLKKVIRALGLPTSVSIEKEGLKTALLKDKKREGEGIHFVLLADMGRAVVQKIDVAVLDTFIDSMYSGR